MHAIPFLRQYISRNSEFKLRCEARVKLVRPPLLLSLFIPVNDLMYLH